MNARHVLNDMHGEWSIGVVLHHILTSHEDLVPNITTDGELGELISKAIKYNMGILMEISRVTYLGIQDLTKDVVEHIVVGLQPNGLPISTMTIQIHILILIHGKSGNVSNGSGGVIPTIQAKKAREGNEINLVVLAFSGPMNEMSLRPGVQVIGGVELTDNLIVPWLAELHQWLQPHPSQVIEQLLHIRSRQFAKLKGVNSLHLNHRSLLLVDEAKKHEVMVEIKMKRLLEPVLDP